MGGTLRADIDALEALGHRLVELEQKLGSLGRDLGVFDTVIGARIVRERLSELAGNWDQARRRVMEELGELGAMAQAAASEYRATEATLADTFSGPAPGQAGAAR
jgi:hypothetical protein